MNRSKKPILYGGRFAGLNREYSREYSVGSAAAWVTTRLGAEDGSAMARLGSGLNDAARREYGARGRQSSSTSRARGLRVVFYAESSGGACGLRPSLMKLILAPVSSS